MGLEQAERDLLQQASRHIAEIKSGEAPGAYFRRHTRVLDAALLGRGLRAPSIVVPDAEVMAIAVETEIGRELAALQNKASALDASGFARIIALCITGYQAILDQRPAAASASKAPEPVDDLVYQRVEPAQPQPAAPAPAASLSMPESADGEAVGSSAAAMAAKLAPVPVAEAL